MHGHVPIETIQSGLVLGNWPRLSPRKFCGGPQSIHVTSSSLPGGFLGSPKRCVVLTCVLPLAEMNMIHIFPVGFKGNLSLLNMLSFFPGDTGF